MPRKARHHPCISPLHPSASGLKFSPRMTTAMNPASRLSLPRRPAGVSGRGWRGLRRLALISAMGLMSATAALSVHAQTTPAMAAAWTRQAQDWIHQQLQSTEPGALPLRPEIEVGTLDSRLRLAPCARIEPYLPAGTRLWGRTRIGLRCNEGPNPWNVFLPIQVRVWGPAWAVRQPVLAGTALTEADVEPVEVDWTEGISPVLARPEDWLGNEAARNLLPGQVLRQGMVRAPQVFTAGTQVRVLVRGQGFTLTASGAALTHGHLGQTARVRMPNRKVLTGTVRDAETVEIAL